MAKIIQLSPHIANLIAAGEVVERPASVAKELLENAVDAGATHVTIEIRDGGMTFLRVTDNGCGMTAEDAKTAFLRHATSKLRSAEELSAISTMGFRGEALAAIASVSRIDLMTKTADTIAGTSLQLEAGAVTEQSEAGCPDGTTIIVRDLFFNTPARMKFMKSDSVEAGKIASAVQAQALAHPEVAFTFIRDGKQVLSTPGTKDLKATVYSIYGSQSAKMVEVDTAWEGYRLTGFVCKPTDARPSRSMQTYFVNDRPVRSKILIAAVEEAYRNQLMSGRFPACVLHLHVPANAVDVNVHPAKTEVKFLNEKAVFDCVHYGVLGALNRTTDRPEVTFRQAPAYQPPRQEAPAAPAQHSAPKSQQDFFRTMTAEEYRNFSTAMKTAPLPNQAAAAATADAVKASMPLTLRQEIPSSSFRLDHIVPPTIQQEVAKMPAPEPVLPEQQQLQMPPEQPWRYVGELYNSFILVEQGEDAFLIDKHAAHERILFEKLRANQEAITSQALFVPVTCQLDPEAAAILLANRPLLDTLGFEVAEFGENTVLVRQIPMDLPEQDIADAIEALASDLLTGKQQDQTALRDELLHTVACKAAIKAGWRSSQEELMLLAQQVMVNEDLKYCPHGRPICINLSKKQLEKQFRRN